MILAGDIGGTNTRLALVEAKNEGMQILVEETFQSRERTSLEAALGEFLFLHKGVLTGASFGIAGPVRNGRCEATNLPWVVDAKTVAKRVRLRRVGLINDLEANAYGIAALQSKDFVILNKGVRGLCRLRRNSLPQTPDPALRRPAPQRQRHGLFFYLWGEPPHHSLHEKCRRPGTCLVELAL